jgi:hypothetical protein
MILKYLKQIEKELKHKIRSTDNKLMNILIKGEANRNISPILIRIQFLN